MKNIKSLLIAITLGLACPAIAHADGIIHTQDGDVQYTTERIGTDVYVTYTKDGEQIERDHYQVNADGSLTLLGQE